jgi:peptidoglycan/xylan/chitin deacetylase (PgdA/CDA1 family)
MRVAMPELWETGASWLGRLRFFDAYAYLKRKHIGSQVAITTYHRVPFSRQNWSIRSQVTLRSFENQIQYLRQNFAILSLDELRQALQRKSLPKRAVVITFDDGYRDNYLYAFPILKKYSIPAMFFLTTGHIGVGKPFWQDRVGYLIHHAMVGHLELDELGSYTIRSAFDRSRATFMIRDNLERLPEQRKNCLIEKLADVCRADIPDDFGSQLVLSWAEVEEMHQDGAEFGAHSVTHPFLTDLPSAQARWEIQQSKEDIERRLGEEVRFFSYPMGQCSSEIVRIVKECGFAGAVTTDWSWISPRSDPYRLGRIPMTESQSKSAALLSGFVGDLGIKSRWSKN